ncbi:MAG: glycosyltransferase family 2 protein [Desulfuromonadaceae bacterium]
MIKTDTMNIDGTPAVTIFLPVYNAATTIGVTLESILAQTYRNIRVVVLDNASSDTTRDVVSSFAERDHRLELLTYTENVGFEGNCSRCLQMATGDYTAIYHADDIYEPWIVEREVAFLETHPEIGAVFTQASYIDATGTFIRDGVPLGGISEEPPSCTIYDFPMAFNKLLRETNFFICPSAMVRSPIYRDHVQVWDERFGASADLWVWLRILQKFKVGILHEPLMRYRLSASQGSVQVNYLRTEKSPFNQVVEHYLENPEVRQIAERSALDTYEIHALRDRLKRSRAALMAGKPELAQDLSQGAWSWRRWRLLFCLGGNFTPTAIAFRSWWSGVTTHMMARMPGQQGIGRALFYFKYTRRYKKLGGSLNTVVTTDDETTPSQ